jgi:N-acetylglucosaminyldiphosphoundecaprenol N-acetyl-beta-D-mannosaminyltransferase
MAGALSRIRDAVKTRQPCFVSTPNLNFVVAGLTDQEFRDSVIESDLSVADGMSIVWTSRLLGLPIRQRVSGSDVFEALRTGRHEPISIYFFGGIEAVAEEACRLLNATPSGLTCAGHAFPGFGSVEDMSSDQTIARVNAAGADFVVVSLGARKGQAWICRNRHRLSSPVISHLGAIVDFVSGRFARAPVWVRRAGLEWLWRIKEDPKLWRRYLSDGFVFARLLFTRVLPHSWLILRRRYARVAAEQAGVDIYNAPAELVIRLHGAWVRSNLKPLRMCFARAALADEDVRIEMERVTYVDSAFIGLVMLLYGSRRKRRRRLSLIAPSKEVRQLFRYACADFLLP